VRNVRRLLVEFVIPHAGTFYRSAEGEAERDRLRTLAGWILTSGKTKIWMSEMARNVRDLRGLSVQDVNKRVSPLVAGGWLEPAAEGSGCRLWNVNPSVSLFFEDRKQQEASRKERLQRLMKRAFMGRAKRGARGG
jgi:hypothetical protein